MEHRQSRKVPFSPAWIKAVKVEAGPVEWRDATAPGLIFRVEVSGRRTWVYRYVADVVQDGKKIRLERRFVLGQYPALGLSDAREKLRKAARQDDPQAGRELAREADAKRKLGEDVDGAVASWLADADSGPSAGLGLSKRREWKGGASGGTARSFMPHVRALGRELAGKRLLDLSHDDCRRFISGETKGATFAPSTRNHRLAVLRSFVAWCLRKGIIEVDPTRETAEKREIQKTKEPPRRRTLTDDEMRTLIIGFDKTRLGPVVRLLAYTACRRDEILGAAWSWLDTEADILRIPAGATKEGDARDAPRLVALSPHAVKVLSAQRKEQLASGSRSEWIFATSTGERPHPDSLKPVLYRLKGMRSNGQPPSKDKRAKPRLALLADDVRIHDVRRTVADALVNRLGVNPWIVDRVVLAHYRSKDEAGYVPELGGKPLDEARAALTRWAEMLDSILVAKPQQAQA